MSPLGDMNMGFMDQAVEIIMLVVMVLVVSAMALLIPAAITAAGFTGAAATIVALITMMFPIAVIVTIVMHLTSSLKGVV
jgi:hypothetical protein